MEWQANDGSYPRQEAGSGWFPSDKVRLFPRNPDIRFNYPVHELVEPSVRKLGWTIASAPVPIHHYGQLNETKNRRKAESYFKLGYAKLDQLGNDGAALRELAVQAGQLGRWTKAIDLWQRFLAVCPAYPEAYANLAGAHWQLGQYDQGIRFSEKAIQADPEIKEGHYNLAVNLIMVGEVVKAEAVLNGILEKHDRYLPARFMLAAVRCGTQDREAGQEAFAKLMKEVPPQVLSIAVKDLVEKLKSSGRSYFAKTVEASASMT
jgi:tetratricopeptide (TPR) repeat protein